jgi:hypothetical protein
MDLGVDIDSCSVPMGHVHLFAGACREKSMDTRWRESLETMLRGALSGMVALAISVSVATVVQETITLIRNEIRTGFYRNQAASRNYSRVGDDLGAWMTGVEVELLRDVPGAATAGLFIGTIVAGFCRKLMRTGTLNRWMAGGTVVTVSISVLISVAAEWDGTFSSIIIAVYKALALGVLVGAAFGASMAICLKALDMVLPSNLLRALYGALGGALVGMAFCTHVLHTPWAWAAIGVFCGAPVGAVLLALYRPVGSGPTLC